MAPQVPLRRWNDILLQKQMFAHEIMIQMTRTMALQNKDIRFIFGSYDICNCNLPGFRNDRIVCYRRYSHCLPNAYGGAGCCDTTRHNNMVVNTCGYRLQGPTRLHRGLLYMQYLRHLWSEQGVSTKSIKSGRGINRERSEGIAENGPRKEYRPMYSIVPHMRHNSSYFYSSPILNKWVRGKHA